jgi:uridine kinase
MKRRTADENEGLARTSSRLLAAIRRLQEEQGSPIVVALDGRSASGKSTLAALVEKSVRAALIPSDDFFAAAIPDGEWDGLPIEERYRQVIDIDRLRTEALEPLIAGKPARWHPFDFEAGLRPDGTYGISADCVERQPADIIIVDGAYSARPELADLVDLAVLVEAPEGERHLRLEAREESGFLARWHRRWDPVEDYYFTIVRPTESFDLIVSFRDES